MKTSLRSLIVKLLARKSLYPINRRLYLLSLNAMGILNYENEKLSGEDHFLKKITSISKDSFVAFDVGANIGNYSRMIRQNQPKSIVYAFEPHPFTFKKLADNAKVGGFNAYNFGCGDQDGELILHDYKNNDGSTHASLFQDVISVLHRGELTCHTVKIIKLDEFIENQKINKINLLKIDVEGNELKVLQGLSSAIASNIIDVIHFEFNEMNVISKTSFLDFWNILENYNFYRLLPNSFLPIETYQSIFHEIYAYQNIIAVNKNIDF